MFTLSVSAIIPLKMHSLLLESVQLLKWQSWYSKSLQLTSFCEQAFSRCAMKAPISLHLQGPPGTGKTRTLLGLLSIVLHAAPKGSIGVSSRPTTRISATRTAEETTRLWKLANPWLSGKAIPRQAETEQLCLLIRVYKLFRQATSY